MRLPSAANALLVVICLTIISEIRIRIVVESSIVTPVISSEIPISVVAVSSIIIAVIVVIILLVISIVEIVSISIVEIVSIPIAEIVSISIVEIVSISIPLIIAEVVVANITVGLIRCISFILPHQNLKPASALYCLPFQIFSVGAD